MNRFLVYSLIIVSGLALVTLTYLKQESEENIEPEIPSAIMIDGKIPPQLSDLFPNREEGPHQKFVDEQSCLVCHKQEMTIPGIGLVPKIPHEYRPDCVSCHFLPSTGI